MFGGRKSVSFTIRRNVASPSTLESASAYTFSLVDTQTKHSTHSNCTQSSKSRRKRRVSLSALLQPFTADLWNALLSTRNVTTLRCQR